MNFRAVPLLLAAAALAGCATTQPKQQVTAGARTSLTQATVASNASVAASNRSSAQIKAFRDDASVIDYKAGRALEILDHP